MQTILFCVETLSRWCKSRFIFTGRRFVGSLPKDISGKSKQLILSTNVFLGVGPHLTRMLLNEANSLSASQCLQSSYEVSHDFHLVINGTACPKCLSYFVKSFISFAFVLFNVCQCLIYKRCPKSYTQIPTNLTCLLRCNDNIGRCYQHNCASLLSSHPRVLMHLSHWRICVKMHARRTFTLLTKLTICWTYPL